jgi:hypothetical protein
LLAVDGNNSQKRFKRWTDNQEPRFVSPYHLPKEFVDDEQIRVTGEDGKVRTEPLACLSYQLAVC